MGVRRQLAGACGFCRGARTGDSPRACAELLERIRGYGLRVRSVLRSRCSLRCFRPAVNDTCSPGRRATVQAIVASAPRRTNAVGRFRCKNFQGAAAGGVFRPSAIAMCGGSRWSARLGGVLGEWVAVSGAEDMCNVSLNAACDYVTRMSGFSRTVILHGFRKSTAAPSTMCFRSVSRIIIKGRTGNVLTARPAGATMFVGHRVNMSSDFSGGAGRFPCRCSPARVSTFVLGGLIGSTGSLKSGPRPVGSIIVAYPTCFKAGRHVRAGRTKRVTNLGMLSVVGRPATTTVSCNMGASRGGAILMCSLKNKAFSIALVGIGNNTVGMVTANKSRRLKKMS